MKKQKLMFGALLAGLVSANVAMAADAPAEGADKDKAADKSQSCHKKGGHKKPGAEKAAGDKQSCSKGGCNKKAGAKNDSPADAAVNKAAEEGK
jgi:hypothetical protein